MEVVQNDDREQGSLLSPDSGINRITKDLNAAIPELEYTALECEGEVLEPRSGMASASFPVSGKAVSVRKRMSPPGRGRESIRAEQNPSSKAAPPCDIPAKWRVSRTRGGIAPETPVRWVSNLISHAASPRAVTDVPLVRRRSHVAWASSVPPAAQCAWASIAPHPARHQSSDVQHARTVTRRTPHVCEIPRITTPPTPVVRSSAFSSRMGKHRSPSGKT